MRNLSIITISLIVLMISQMSAADEHDRLVPMAPPQQVMGAGLVVPPPARKNVLLCMCALCADCLEQKRDQFPCSWVVAYGRCVACCSMTDEAYGRYMAAPPGNAADARARDEGGWFDFGDRNDYHCTQEIILNHCMCCVCCGTVVASCAMLAH